MKRRLIIPAFALVAAFLGYWLICTGAPRQKPIVVDGEPHILQIAPLELALTFAIGQREGDHAKLVLVTSVNEAGIYGINISAATGVSSLEPFDVMSAVGQESMTALAEADAVVIAYAWSELEPTAQHFANIGFGTNYAGHGEEVGNDEVFAFPKYGRPTAAVAAFDAYSQDRLLDYEVEICVRFDRDIGSHDDFETAGKVLFLCGDMTDRAALVRHVPIGEEPLSGRGFADGKSGQGMMPTGPFLVIPKDWQSFIVEEHITTSLNGGLRQDATGGQMILGIREMVQFVLESGAAENWDYQGAPAALIDQAFIPKGMTILTGTPEGVLFDPPGSLEMACGVVAYVCLGQFVSGTPVIRFLIERFVSARAGNGYYLEPGDVVTHESRYLGRIEIELKRPGESER